MHKHLKRLIPFFVLLLCILLVYFSNIHQTFTLEWIRQEEQRLDSFVHNHPITSPLLFLGIYILSVCLVIPDSTILTLLAGLVFPLPLAIAYSVIAETIGAMIFFFIFRLVFTESLIKRELSFFKTLRHRFRKHQAIYLLFLRLTHVIPFWLTNVAAAYFTVSYKVFLWVTLVGVIPLSYILANAGRSLHKLFAENQVLTFSDILTPQVKLSLLVLGLLSFLPLLYKKFRGKKGWFQ